jgi:hypothetical protein
VVESTPEEKFVASSSHAGGSFGPTIGKGRVVVRYLSLYKTCTQVTDMIADGEQGIADLARGAPGAGSLYVDASLGQPWLLFCPFVRVTGKIRSYDGR